MKHVSLDNLPPSSVSHNQDVIKKVILKFNEIPNVTQYAQATLVPGQISAKHKHEDMFEVFTFLQVPEGKIEVEVDGKVLYVKSGDTVAVQPGEFHEIRHIGVEGDAPLVMNYFGVLDTRAKV